MAYYDGPRSEERDDARLRAKVLHYEAKDLMHAPARAARDLVPMPWRVVGRKTKVLHGYIVGSPAERAAAAMDLVPTGYVSRPFGEVLYVESRKAVAKPVRRSTLAERLDAQASYAERFEAFTNELRAAGTIVMGQMD